MLLAGPSGWRQVHRFSRVAGQEQHAQEVEEAAQDAPGPVARAAVFSLLVCDRHFADAETLPEREGRDEAEEVAVHGDRLQDFPAVRLEAAVHVVQLDARRQAHRRVEDPRQHQAVHGVEPIHLPADDDIEPLLDLLDELVQIGRIVLEIRVHGDDDLALRALETGRQAHRLAEVRAQADTADARIFAVQLGDDLPGVVGAAVVDEDELVADAARLEAVAHPVRQLGQAFGLVEAGDDDRHERDGDGEPTARLERELGLEGRRRLGHQRRGR